jgi:hypothetical protein
MWKRISKLPVVSSNSDHAIWKTHPAGMGLRIGVFDYRDVWSVFEDRTSII